MAMHPYSSEKAEFEVPLWGFPLLYKSYDSIHLITLLDFIFWGKFRHIIRDAYGVQVPRQK